MMEKNDKEPTTSKHRLNLDAAIKTLLVVLCVVVVVQFTVVAKGFASLNDRLDALDKRTLGFKYDSAGKKRAKRSIDENEFKSVIFKLKMLEQRFNQSYHLVGRQPAFLFRGLPGTPGTPGTPGVRGTPGTPGTPGTGGTPGSPGTPGPQGKPGKDGRDGKNGVQGPKGDPGVKGKHGAQGPQGLKGIQGESGETGVSYIRWGKKTCPKTGAKLVYEAPTTGVQSKIEMAISTLNVIYDNLDTPCFKDSGNVPNVATPRDSSNPPLSGGYVGGSHYSHRGSGSNYVCLTRDPIYAKYEAGHQTLRAKMYGAEYQSFFTGLYPSSLHDHDVPCAVCHVIKRASQIMIPGRNVCPAGWTREYKGYLMAERYDQHRTMFTCVDEYPDYTRGTHANLDGVLLFFTEGVCGSLPCKPYIGGQELTCAVCTR